MSIRATKRTRAPNPNPVIVVTGMTPDEVALLDAHVARCNDNLRAQGARTSRNAVIVTALRDLLSRIVAPDSDTTAALVRAST